MKELPAWVYDIEYADGAVAVSPAARERLEKVAAELGMSLEVFLLASLRLFSRSVGDESPGDAHLGNTPVDTERWPGITVGEELFPVSVTFKIDPPIKDNKRPARRSTASSRKRLAPQYLNAVITPYLIALEELQHIVDEINEQEPTNVRIRSLSENSPITATVEGIAEAAKITQDYVIPWRRKHAEAMAKLEEQEKVEIIAAKQAEVAESYARTQKERREADRLSAEASVKRAEAERIHLENAKLRLDLKRAEIELAIDILNKIGAHLSEIERAEYIQRLLPVLKVLTTSELELSDGTKPSRYKLL